MPQPSTPRTLVAALRPPFLLLTFVCVALGAASVVWAGGTLPTSDLIVVLLGALAAHAAVNLLNEWHDWSSGLDAITQRTPFSGGSGALPALPSAAGAVRALGLALTMFTILCGLWLMWRRPERALALLPVGLAGLALVAAYTPWITRRPWACLLAPGLGFGPLMVGGTHLALGGATPGSALLASLTPMALASGLLLLNQFPDVDADRRVGRRHLPLLRGRAWAARLLGALFAVTYAAPLLGVGFGALPAGALLALGTAPLAWRVVRDALRFADDLPALRPTLARNVALTLVTPLLLGSGALLLD